MQDEASDFPATNPGHQEPLPIRKRSVKKIVAVLHDQKFSPYDLSTVLLPSSDLPPEIWTTVQAAPATFSPQPFLDVVQNLLENPNLTTSFLARAELAYTSFTDATFSPFAQTPEDLASVIKHLRPECRPRLVSGGLDGYDLQWTAVRKLIPRNPKVDNAIMQTCHLFKSEKDVKICTKTGGDVLAKAERYAMIYIPHVSEPEEMPFYHPKVESLAILYTYFQDYDSSLYTLSSRGILSVHYSLFSSFTLENRLERTALKLLEVVHKHSHGQEAGYQKRVHHDRIVGQKRFQDTYAYLKGKYAKDLINCWVEQTPPEKHVFEDLGIAAFLIEVWIDMYSSNKVNTVGSRICVEEVQNILDKREEKAKQLFPGFVDIGCGNGLLVHILSLEGWSGWGFDARARKTWNTFPTSTASNLEELLLVPKIFEEDYNIEHNAVTSHSGVFPSGTFIISNHADELTPWTPLLAYLSDSPFIAIPCCSHDFGGTRFRAPVHTKYVVADPNQKNQKNKNPSAYTSLCSWVCHLTESVGYEAEREFLRIPSTRNIAILGRRRREEMGKEADGQQEALKVIVSLVEKEMNGRISIEELSRMWCKNGEGLMKQAKGCH